MEHLAARKYIIMGFRRVFGSDPNVPKAQAVGGVSILETGYGEWWKGAGKGSFNMGAITAGPSWKGSTFEYRDSRPDPKNPGRDIWYVTKFRKYPDAAAGFEDLVRLVLKTNGRDKKVLPSATAGDLYGVSAGLYRSGYYTGVASDPTPAARIARHHQALSGAVQKIARALNEPMPDGSQIPPRTLKRYDTGEDVRDVQRALGVVADGIFGKITEDAVKKFQKKQGLAVDGKVGPATRKALGI